MRVFDDMLDGLFCDLQKEPLNRSLNFCPVTCIRYHFNVSVEKTEQNLLVVTD